MGENRSNSISRRSFLKGALATGALAAGGTSYLAKAADPPVALASEHSDESTASASDKSASQCHGGETDSAGDQIFCGVCRGNCYGGCFLNVHVRDGKVVRTSARDLPENQWKRICARGLSHVWRVYDPKRVKYPMKRVDGTPRGGGQWEQITWDEAFQLMADKWKANVQQYGPQSNCYFAGAGQFGFLNNFNRFMYMTGATKIDQALDVAVQYMSVRMMGVGENFSCNTVDDMKNSKTIVIWGSNPAVSQPQSMHFITEARDAGAKVIDIDPVYSSTAALCNQWVPIASGTDGLLAMAIMQTIIDKGWTNEEFIKSKTTGPCLVKDSDGLLLRKSDLDATVAEEDDALLFMGADGIVGTAEDVSDPVLEGRFEVEGIKVTTGYTLLLERLAEYPIEDAVRITNVPQDVIEQLAYDMSVNQPCFIYSCLGLDHYYNGFQSYQCMFGIPMLTGSTGYHGASVGNAELYWQSWFNVMGKYSWYPEEGATLPHLTIPCTIMNDVMDSGAFMGQEIQPRFLFVHRGNIITNMCDRNYTLSWLDKFDFIVDCDLTFSESARYADLVLPVCHWFEYEDMGAEYAMQIFLEHQEKCIDPLYESKSDFDIIKGFAGALGLGDKFDYDFAEFCEDFCDSEMGHELGLNYKNLCEKGALRSVPGSEEDPYVYAENGVFNTPTGRCNLYDEAPYASTDYGQDYDLSRDHLPYWEPPLEVGVDGEVDEQYPLQVFSDHQKLHTHSQWFTVDAIMELDPEPTIRLNPEDARKYGVAEGDLARLYNERGFAVMRVHESGGVRPGMAVCSRGFDSEQYVAGNFQDLMNRTTHNTCVTQPFFDCKGAIEKYDADGAQTDDEGVATSTEHEEA